MKKVATIIAVVFITIGFANCKPSGSKNEENKIEENTIEQNSSLSVSGEIINIENGKDGYMATIKDVNGKEYIATISFVNLQKSGGTYKKHEVGETISVEGLQWQDENGVTHITVKQLK